MEGYLEKALFIWAVSKGIIFVIIHCADNSSVVF